MFDVILYQCSVSYDMRSADIQLNIIYYTTNFKWKDDNYDKAFLKTCQYLTVGNDDHERVCFGSG